MTRDYAKPKRRGKPRNTRRKPAGNSAPGWLWLLAGILIGVLVTGLVRLSDTGTPADNQATAGDDDGEAPSQEGPRFDFYTLLKETEVIVPEESEGDAKAPGDETPNRPSPTGPDKAESGDVFILQAGSFKNAGDADSLRARLLLLNMNASVQKVSLRPGETWHRVLVGPFTSTRNLSEARSTLMQNGIDSIQIKRR